MSLADFRSFLGGIAPLGGTLEPCSADGAPHRRPGTFSVPVSSLAAADLPAHPDLYLVRFSGPRNFTTPTTDPWTWLPDLGCWLIPQLNDSGAQIGWLRLIERKS